MKASNQSDLEQVVGLEKRSVVSSTNASSMEITVYPGVIKSEVKNDL